MRESGVVADAVGNERRLHLAVAVFMLQAFAVERDAARSAAQQEAARLHVARRPGQIAKALKAEYGVVHVERNHDPVRSAVARGGGNPAGHAARFVDAFLKNLVERVGAGSPCTGELAPSMMAAVIGLPDETAEKICAEITDEVVVCANYNCPGQIVISGSM